MNIFSLARAVYRRANTYLLDDPLSAVDAHVGRHLFDSVIGPEGRLAKQHATRILVTHQVHYLKDADWIIVLRDGKVDFQGTPFELTKSGIDIAELLDVPEETKNLQETKESMGTKNRTNSRSSMRSHTTSKMSLHSHIEDVENEENELDDNDRKKSVDAPIAELEKTSKGTVKGSPLANYMKAGAHSVFVFLLFLIFVATQVIASMADYWVAFWTSQEEMRGYYENLNRNNTDALNNSTAVLNDTLLDFNVPDISDSFNDTFVNTTVSPIALENNLLSTTTCLYIHGGLILSLLIFAITRSIGFYSCCIRASQNLHDMMFHGIISVNFELIHYVFFKLLFSFIKRIIVLF